jgi:DNA-binding transcriptional LysR family regulator
LLVDAEPHLIGFRQLEQRATSLASDGESEIRLSVDSIFPNSRLFSILAEFTRQFPYAQIKLRQNTFLSADFEFSAHKSQLCIVGLISGEYFAKPILTIQMIAVANRDDPLHLLKRKLTRTDLVQHMLVVIEGIASGGARRQPRSAAQRCLPVSSIDAAIDAVRSGFSFGWLPRYRIQPHLDSHELRPLALPAGGNREVLLSLICKDPNAASREVKALLQLFGTEREMERIYVSRFKIPI